MTLDNDSNVPDWGAVQLDYEQSNGSLKAICERYQITEAQLRHRRERHGWHMRNAWGLRIGPMIGRMLRVLDQQVRELEKQVTDPLDKNATLLGVMTKTLEKLMHLDAVERSKRPEKRKEMSDLRNKLAERIVQLKQDE